MLAGSVRQSWNTALAAGPRSTEVKGGDLEIWVDVHCAFSQAQITTQLQPPPSQPRLESFIRRTDEEAKFDRPRVGVRAGVCVEE